MTVYQKLLKAREDMGHVKKDGKHQQGWSYFKGDEILEQVGNALMANGLIFLPIQESAEMNTAVETKGEGNSQKSQVVETALIRFNMTFVDVETGETVSIPTHGSARDYGDKAIFKAQTLAIKYLFLRMFLLGEGDGEDPDAVSTPPARNAQPKQDRRIPAPAEPPANGKQEGTNGQRDSVVDHAQTDAEFQATRQWINEARVKGLVDWARGFWTEDGKDPPPHPQVYRRIAKALKLSVEAPQNFDELYRLVFNEYGGSDADAMKAIKLYEPTSTRAAKATA